MEVNHVRPPFDRNRAADDEQPSSRRLFSSLRSSPQPRSISRSALVAAILTIICSVPSALHAQRHRGHGSYGQQLGGLTCGAASITSAGTDACTVTLTQAAGNRGVTVSLTSSTSALKIPASVTVPSGASSAVFTATASAVASAQTVTLTASDRSNSRTLTLQLQPPSSGSAALTLGSTSVAFGNVSVNTPATQTVRLTSSGTAPLTISGASIQGTGFSISGMSTPLTLAPAQTATLDLQFKPAAAGTDTGTVSISSNAASGGNSIIALSGTGTSGSSYEVQLNWSHPPSSSDAVIGYNIYRAANGGAYQRLNASANQSTTYTDTTVQSATSYSYEVMSVDASGAESLPSNIYAAAVP